MPRKLPDLTKLHLSQLTFCLLGDLDRVALAATAGVSELPEDGAIAIGTEYTRNGAKHGAVLIAERQAEDEQAAAGGALHIIISLASAGFPADAPAISVRGHRLQFGEGTLRVSEFERVIRGIVPVADPAHPGYLSAALCLPGDQYASEFDLPMAIGTGVELRGVRFEDSAGGSVIIDLGARGSEGIYVRLDCDYVPGAADVIDGALSVVSERTAPFVRVRGERP